MGDGARDAGHLPNLRGADGPADPDRLPRQRRGRRRRCTAATPTTTCSTSRALGRADPRGRARARRRRALAAFFTEAEGDALAAFCDVVLAQDAEPRIPVLALVDDEARRGRLDGYQYADMPDDRETWRLVARGLDQAAQPGAASYASASAERSQEIVGEFAEASSGRRLGAS